MATNLLEANAAPSPSIWQKLSGASGAQGTVASKRVVKKTPHVVTTAAVKKTATPLAKYTAQSIAASGMNGQVVLFLGKGDKSNALNAPAAALTIHTSLPNLRQWKPLQKRRLQNRRWSQ